MSKAAETLTLMGYAALAARQTQPHVREWVSADMSVIRAGRMPRRRPGESLTTDDVADIQAAEAFMELGSVMMYGLLDIEQPEPWKQNPYVQRALGVGRDISPYSAQEAHALFGVATLSDIPEDQMYMVKAVFKNIMSEQESITEELLLKADIATMLFERRGTAMIKMVDVASVLEEVRSTESDSVSPDAVTFNERGEVRSIVYRVGDFASEAISHAEEVEVPYYATLRQANAQSLLRDVLADLVECAAAVKS